MGAFLLTRHGFYDIISSIEGEENMNWKDTLFAILILLLTVSVVFIIPWTLFIMIGIHSEQIILTMCGYIFLRICVRGLSNGKKTLAGSPCFVTIPLAGITAYLIFHNLHTALNVACGVAFGDMIPDSLMIVFWLLLGKIRHNSFCHYFMEAMKEGNRLKDLLI